MITLYYPNGHCAVFDNNQWNVHYNLMTNDGRPAFWKYVGDYGADVRICKDLKDFIKLAYKMYDNRR